MISNFWNSYEYNFMHLNFSLFNKLWDMVISTSLLSWIFDGLVLLCFWWNCFFKLFFTKNISVENINVALNVKICIRVLWILWIYGQIWKLTILNAYIAIMFTRKYNFHITSSMMKSIPSSRIKTMAYLLYGSYRNSYH